jgi:hypothetical protein
MFRRLFVGLVLGLVVGGLVAVGLVQGLHQTLFGADTMGALFAYLSAAVTGVLTGLVAGKPIWAAGARIEAGLKAFFGALLAAGLMFALRQWAGGVHLPVTELTPEGAVIGSLPIASLPVVAALLGGFFEIDTTGDDEGGKKRVAAEGANGKGKARVAADDDAAEADEGAAAPPKRAKR